MALSWRTQDQHMCCDGVTHLCESARVLDRLQEPILVVQEEVPDRGSHLRTAHDGALRWVSGALARERGSW